MHSDERDNGDPSLPKEPLSDEEYIRRLEELERDFEELGVRVDRLLEPHLKELAGGHLETMLISPEETLKYLNDPNPKLRRAALQLAYHKWNMKDTLAAVYENMALSDPDDAVRETAIRALGTCYRRTKHPRMGRLLAGIARNEDLAERTRVTAFTSLLGLHGNIDYTGTSPLVPQSLAEIDWDFVDDYYRAKHKGTS